MGQRRNELRNRLIANINVRVPLSLVEDAIASVVVDKLFDSEAEYYRTAIQLGSKVIALDRIKKDPKKRKEFEEKLSQILTMTDIEQTMATCSDDQLRNIEFLAKNIREKKVNQMILDIQRKS